MSVDSTVTSLRELYIAKGSFYYGEDITQLAHALHCAELAKIKGCTPTLIIAAFFHDIGHLIESPAPVTQWGNIDHADIGAIFLTDLHFTNAVVEPIRLHVAAKRYRCFRGPNYFHRLSTASQKTLELQGGPMSASEALNFESQEFFEEALLLREFDDNGKARVASIEETDWIFDLTRDYLQYYLATTQASADH